MNNLKLLPQLEADNSSRAALIWSGFQLRLILYAVRLQAGCFRLDVWFGAKFWDNWIEFTGHQAKSKRLKEHSDVIWVILAAYKNYL